MCLIGIAISFNLPGSVVIEPIRRIFTVACEGFKWEFPSLRAMNVSKKMFIVMVLALVITLVLAVSAKPEAVELRSYVPMNRRVVCSLTTRPVQPEYFGKVLDRLVEQFDAVYLALPRVSCKGVTYPKITHPGVTIVPVEKDYGPITKFFGALDSKEPPDTLVVVVDDDIIYDPTVREVCEKNYAKHPNCVVSGAGIVYKYSSLELPWFMCMTGRREQYFPLLPSFLGSSVTTTVCGYASISFRRGLIQREKLLDFIGFHNKDQDCFFNDDIVISAFLSSQGIPRLCKKVPACTHHPEKGTESLSSVSDAQKESIQERQYRAFQKLRDCFRNDSPRFDCICLFDLVSALILVIIAKWVVYNHPVH